MTNPVSALWGNREEKQAWKAMEARADALPREFASTYGALKSYLWKFTADDDGKDVVAALGRILSVFETSAAEGTEVVEVTGPDLAAFADGYLPASRPAYQSSWRDQLNRAAVQRRS